MSQTRRRAQGFDACSSFRDEQSVKREIVGDLVSNLSSLEAQFSLSYCNFRQAGENRAQYHWLITGLGSCSARLSRDQYCLHCSPSEVTGAEPSVCTLQRILYTWVSQLYGQIWLRLNKALKPLMSGSVSFAIINKQALEIRNTSIAWVADGNSHLACV